MKRYLGKADREDIGEEIHSILEAKLDEAEETKGASLEEDEVLAILKEFGHPLEVASRYRRPRQPINESLLPLYKQVVKYLLLGFFALIVGSALISASGLIESWPEDMDDNIMTVGFVWFATVTAAFFFSDTLLGGVDLFGKWDPRRLPPVRRGAAIIPLFDSIVGLIAGLVVFSVLSAIDNDYSWEALTAQSDTPWATVVLWCKLRILFGMLLHGVALFRPYWSRPKLLYSALTDVFLAAIAIWAMTIIRAMAFDDTAVYLQGVFLAVAGCVFVVALGGALSSLYRMSKMGAGDPGSGAPDLLATFLGLSAAAKNARELVEANGEKALNKIERVEEDSKPNNG